MMASGDDLLVMTVGNCFHQGAHRKQMAHLNWAIVGEFNKGTIGKLIII